MIEELKRILKNISGRVVALGFRTEKFEKILTVNTNITSFDTLNEISKKENKIFGKKKKLSIDKLRKKYGKKNIDVVIINSDAMTKYISYIIKETIYIGKKDLYIYGNKENNYEFLKKYKRYKIITEEMGYKDNSIIKLDISKSKVNRVKEKIYLVIDFFDKILEMIRELLTY
ncbi:MAG: hypothetical protein PHD02_00360 [Bacilli bacterium]|nr:hypothetical protein [Bacilli bacterium]